MVQLSPCRIVMSVLYSTNGNISPEHSGRYKVRVYEGLDNRCTHKEGATYYSRKNLPAWPFSPGCNFACTFSYLFSHLTNNLPVSGFTMEADDVTSG